MKQLEFEFEYDNLDKTIEQDFDWRLSNTSGTLFPIQNSLPYYFSFEEEDDNYYPKPEASELES